MILFAFRSTTSRFVGPLTRWLFGLVLTLSACEPQLPMSDPLPTELRVNPQPDSIITPPTELDFSIVSELGQGPSGTLTRTNVVGSPSGSYTAYTYDRQSHLIGRCERTSYGYNELSLVRYQGDYIAQVYKGVRYFYEPSTRVNLGWITNYGYDEQRRLSQVLMYENVASRFKLSQIVQYDYSVAGSLQLTRHTYSLAFNSLKGDKGIYPTDLRYWENGDNYRLETYIPNQAPVLPPKRDFYNQVVNPLARLHLWPQNPLSTHYLVGSGVTGLEQEAYQYRYTYDGQGRLSSVQRRSVIGYYSSIVTWTDWSYRDEFVYAP